jgi:hypothetical protein
MISLANATDYVEFAATGKIVSGSTERRSALPRWAHNDFADIDMATNEVVSFSVQKSVLPTQVGDVNRLWIRGGFPESLLAPERASPWRLVVSTLDSASHKIETEGMESERRLPQLSI